MYFIKQVFLFKIFFSDWIPEESRREYMKNTLKELKLEKIYFSRWYSRYKRRKHPETEDELLRGRILDEIAESGETALNE